MSGSVNKAIIIGNLGNDPEVRSFQDGGQICTFSVATSETWNDKNTGEKRERTEWHRVVLRQDGLIRVAQQYLRKGHKVYVEGRLQTRKWQDQSGQEKYSTEIVVGPGGTLTMLGGRGEGGGGGDRDFGGGGAQGGGGRDFGGPAGGLDDEIPF